VPSVPSSTPAIPTDASPSAAVAASAGTPASRRSGRVRTLVAAAVMATSAACGGGGGGSATPAAGDASNQPQAGTGSSQIKSVMAISQTRDNTLVVDANGVLWARGSNVGGALGIAVGDRILMMENTWYSVISPEGCAAILYRDAASAPLAAEAMRVSPADLLKLNIIDRVIKEPVGGAHHHPDEAAQILQQALIQEIAELDKIPAAKRVPLRVNKFAQMGLFLE